MCREAHNKSVENVCGNTSAGWGTTTGDNPVRSTDGDTAQTATRPGGEINPPRDIYGQADNAQCETKSGARVIRGGTPGITGSTEDMGGGPEGSQSWLPLGSYLTPAGWLNRIAKPAVLYSFISLNLVAAQPDTWVPAQHHVPGPVLHITAGITIATSAMVPPLRKNEEIPPPYWITAYSVWGASCALLLILEMLRRRSWLQRRLLGGLVLLTGLNILGTLAQGEPSTLEGVVNWAPLALTASLCIIPVIIEVMGPGGVAAAAL